MGLVELCLKTLNQVPYMMVLLGIVPVNVPALLGLDVLDTEKLCADKFSNRIILRYSRGKAKYEDDWSVLIARHDGHLYASMFSYFRHSTPQPNSASFTATSRTNQLMSCPIFWNEQVWGCHNGYARVPDGDCSQQRTLPENQECPFRFWVTIGHENVQFNPRAYINILHLDSKSALHVVDETNRFSAARLLAKLSTEAVRDAIGPS